MTDRQPVEDAKSKLARCSEKLPPPSGHRHGLAGFAHTDCEGSRSHLGSTGASIYLTASNGRCLISAKFVPSVVSPVPEIKPPTYARSETFSYRPAADSAGFEFGLDQDGRFRIPASRKRVKRAKSRLFALPFTGGLPCYPASAPVFWPAAKQLAVRGGQAVDGCIERLTAGQIEKIRRRRGALKARINCVRAEAFVPAPSDLPSNLPLTRRHRLREDRLKKRRFRAQH